MTWPVALDRIARAEASGAHAWYLAHSEVLGERFRTDLDAVIARVADNPLQFPVVEEDVRCARMRRFPYGVFFRIAGERVRVIACLHGRRDAQQWQRRL